MWNPFWFGEQWKRWIILLIHMTTKTLSLDNFLGRWAFQRIWVAYGTNNGEINMTILLTLQCFVPTFPFSFQIIVFIFWLKMRPCTGEREKIDFQFSEHVFLYIFPHFQDARTTTNNCSVILKQDDTGERIRTRRGKKRKKYLTKRQ